MTDAYDPPPEVREVLAALDRRGRHGWATVALPAETFVEALVVALQLVDLDTGAFDAAAVRGTATLGDRWLTEQFAVVACRAQAGGAVDAVADRYLHRIERRIRSRRPPDPDGRIAAIRRAVLDGPQSAIAGYTWGFGDGLQRFLEAQAKRLDASLGRRSAITTQHPK